MTEIAALRGCRLQRIDGPRPDLFALTLYRAGLEGALVLSLERRRVDWGLADDRPRGDPASAFVGLMRKHLENAFVEEARVVSGGVTLSLSRGDARLVLAADPPNLVVEVGGRVAGAAFPGRLREVGAASGEPFPPLEEGPPSIPCTLEALRAHGPELVERRLRSELLERRRELRRGVARRIRKLARRLAKIEGDLDRVDEVPALRHRAGLLLSALSSIPEDAREAEVTDWALDPPGPVTIPIDPKRTPREEADALFTRARKLERGGAIAMERHAATTEERSRLEALLPRIEEADEGSLDDLRREAARLGVTRSAKGSRSDAPRRPHRRFESRGRTILVGRNAEDNDALTLSAKPWHHWLHARGVPGSHVVVPLERREPCPPDLLADAAHLAAHFSAARGEPIVDVQHCARRHVRKVKGAPAGAVLVEREKVLALRVEPDRLATLLANEER